MHPVINPPFSYGQGKTTFTAANGDELYATYWGSADHSFDEDGTEIKTYGIFTDGTGRFEGASGTFLWEGLFKASFTPVPGDGTTTGTAFGTGAVIVKGKIKY